MVVDSCKGRGRRHPAALEYLAEIGVPAEAIVAIVATHWHDDHVRGISEVYDQAPDAAFYVASSIRPDEFLALTGQEAMASRFTSGVSELSRVAAIAVERGVPVRYAAAAQRLINRPGSAVSEVWALSPSDEDIGISRRHLAALLPSFQAGARRVPALEPNDTSVVLLLQTECGGVLLGGDLEHPASRLRGWHAVMDLEAAPDDRSDLIKVPHHGSSNAHCPEVWEHRVGEDAVAVVTPFDRGRASLPRPADRQRLRDLTSRGYLTSDKRAASVPRDRSTLKTLRDAVRSYDPHTLVMGHVQLRGDQDGWHVAGTEEVVAI
jgi:hypothetical protein